ILLNESKELLNVIYNRGPDFMNVVEYNNEDKTIINFNEQFSKLYNYGELFTYLTNSNNVIFMSSVLSLRGINNLTQQPLCDNSTMNILQYNGEIFSIFDKNFTQKLNIDLYRDNDGLVLFNMLNLFSMEFEDEKAKMSSLSSNTTSV